MPRQNRVTPFGEIVAVAARGTRMGNRPCAECRRHRFNEFRAAWVANSTGLASDHKPTAGGSARAAGRCGTPPPAPGCRTGRA